MNVLGIFMVVLISLCIVTFVPTFVFVAVKHHGFKSQKECSGFRILEEVTTRGVSTISCLQASTKITSSFLVRAFDLARFNCSKIFAASRADVPNLATMIAFGICLHPLFPSKTVSGGSLVPVVYHPFQDVPLPPTIGHQQVQDRHS